MSSAFEPTINIIVLDDSPDAAGLDILKSDIEHVVNQQSQLSYKVNIFVVNPNNYIKQYTGPESLADLNAHLESFANTKIDLFLCDFNLNSKEKDLAFHIMHHFRSFNKASSLILYSGSPLKELTRINNQLLASKLVDHIRSENKSVDTEKLKSKINEIAEEVLPAEELLQLAIKSQITSIVKRTLFQDEAVKVIKTPSLLLQLDNHLSLYPPGTHFEGTGTSLDALSCEVILSNIRKQTPEGLQFVRELIELLCSNHLSVS